MESLIDQSGAVPGWRCGGTWASSTAVIGAGLDNLGDAVVYGVSLYAVGRSDAIKTRAAQLSGWLLIGFACLLLIEVVRRFLGGEAPLGPAMMGMAAANAFLNIYCIRPLEAASRPGHQLQGFRYLHE